MTTEKIFLRPDDERVTLTTYISNDEDLGLPPRPAMIVLPGGAYCFLAAREGEPLALDYLSEGFNSFVLHYSIGTEAVYPKPLVDVSLAIRYVRENAEKYHVDPTRIFVTGSSAGGHLAAAIGSLWHKDFAKTDADMPEFINKPNATVLCYPVISSGEKAHRDSFTNILGTATPTKEQNEAYSMELQVNEDTAPVFIWHTTPDDCVPVENTLMMAMALQEKKIPFEMRIYNEGVHGLSLANKQTWCQAEHLDRPHVARWFGDAVEWLKKL